MSYEYVEIPDVNEDQLMKVFDTITNIISKSIKESPDTGGKTLASIHYKLHLDFFESKNEKARLALMFLQAQLGKLICDAGRSREVGMLIYSYTRHWLRFVLILESQMSTYLSWYTFKKESPFNLVPIISAIEDNLPILLDDNIEGLPKDIIKDFREFANAANDDAGEELKNWLDFLMRQALYNNDDLSLETLSQFQKSAPELMEVDEFNVEFNTLFHQYGESWFNEIVIRKKWLNNVITKLDLFDEKNIQRLANGFYWRKFGGKSFGDVIKEIAEKNKPKVYEDMQSVRNQLKSDDLDLGL
ncbi:MAG: hypothetical protein HeimC3_15770 [Candidatus Heimdallarchaeota archaeon LC_3]|nr:MAG: hypothetical protein HeimC3_15770 [Candidatus Heimdallarchaeota archaeon LC_3]